MKPLQNKMMRYTYYGKGDWYCRFGFVLAEKYQIGTSDNMYAVALQALELQEGALLNIKSQFIEDKIYDIDEMAAKEIDLESLPKELCNDLPTQMRFQKIVKMRKDRQFVIEF